jgi:hypothetical protein
MIESPVLQELKAEWTREAAREAAHKATLETERRCLVLLPVERFGPQAESVGVALQTVDDEARLMGLVRLAALCPDLEAFQGQLSAA